MATNTVTANLCSYIDSISKPVYNQVGEFQKTIMSDLQISQEDYRNLYVLKYHIEKENKSDMDKALQFLNKLIDLYTQNRAYEIECVQSIDELYKGKFTESEEENKLLDQMRINSGIVNGPHSSISFKDSRAVVCVKDIIVQKDGSVLYQIDSTEELARFEQLLFSKVSYLYDKQRTIEIKEKIGSLTVENFFDGKTDTYICVGKRTPTDILFSVFGKKYKLFTGEGNAIMDFDTYEIKGVQIGVCVI